MAKTYTSIRLTRDNELFSTFDKAWNSRNANEAKQRLIMGNSLIEMYRTNLIVQFVTEAINDDTAFHNSDTDKMKTDKQNYFRKPKRIVANNNTKGEGKDRVVTRYLDLGWNASDKVYRPEIKDVPSGYYVDLKNGEVHKNKATTTTDDVEPERPDTSDMIKNLTSDNEGLVKSLNDSATDIATKDETIAEMQKVIDAHVAEIERLKKDKDVLVNAIKNTPRVPKAIQAMVV